MATVTIIGTGNMARGIGSVAVAGGHRVQLLGTSEEKARALAAELSAQAQSTEVTTGAVGDDIAGDVVVLAVWYAAVADVLDRYRGALDGKVLVDITNPVNVETFDDLVTPPDSSAAEEIAKQAGGARVVKAFNTTFAGTLVSRQVAGAPLDVFLASDDEEAKAQVAALAESAGLRPVDAGPLRRARQLEGLGFLHMTVQNALGSGYGSTVKVVTP